MSGAAASPDLSFYAGQESYKPVAAVGEGSFGQVWLAIHRPTNQPVAVKLIPRGNKCNRNVRNELRSNAVLGHPHVVRFRNLFLTDTDLAIVFEYCGGGNLQQYVSRKGPLPEAEARCFFQQLILAVDYCHHMGVVNRDIKLENAMLQGDAQLLKLTDFGYAKTDIESRPISKVGTPNYAAPEVIQPDEIDYDGRQADAWSCGVFLYALLFCKYPFEREDDPCSRKGVAKVLQRTMVCDYEVPDNVKVSWNALDLIRRLLVKDPFQRYTILDIMRHPFFRTDLPPAAAGLNAYCLSQQATAQQALRRERWVVSVWNEAREESMHLSDSDLSQQSAIHLSRSGFEQISRHRDYSRGSSRTSEE